MKFLADAHISMELVAMVRALGHDCLDGSRIPARMADVGVLRMAAADQRIIITADKDFGELVFVHGVNCPGILLVRLTLATEHARVAHLRGIWPVILSRPPGSFVTVSATAVRARPIPWCATS